MEQGYEDLINSLIADNYLKTPEIIEAFKNTDRADFVLEEQKEKAYLNTALPIGFGQTISQPLVVAFMLELLQPRQGEKILDVGVGSGWTSALLAYLAKENGKVIGVEIIPELKEMGERNIAKYNYIEKDVAGVFLADGSRGYKKEAPFDRILSGAASKGDVPRAWKSQLKIGGRIVAPVDDSIVVIDKISKIKYNYKKHFGFIFVPLVEK